MKNLYIIELNESTQELVKVELTNALVELGYKDSELNELVENGMSGKVSDLEDTFNILEVLAIAEIATFENFQDLENFYNNNQDLFTHDFNEDFEQVESIHDLQDIQAFMIEDLKGGK